MSWNAGRLLLTGSGICDLATGAALVTAPAWVFAVLRLPALPEESWILMRWLGVFVGCVGFAGVWPNFAPARHAAAAEITTVARLAVAGFLAVAVCGNALPSAWLLVGTFDAIVALAQLAFRARGDYA
ncbi:MAG TPA: hypothetical protein VF139_03545 [Candidatus Polarisedimenticolaceae bacterium]